MKVVRRGVGVNWQFTLKHTEFKGLNQQWPDLFGLMVDMSGRDQICLVKDQISLVNSNLVQQKSRSDV
jgi:hypothetical protein